MIETITSLLILVGLFFLLVGTMGMNRLPDVYNRLHATAKCSTLGVMSILAASIIYFSSLTPTLSVKQFAALIFLFLSSPVGAHMISRAAYLVGVPLTERTVRDDLAERHDTISQSE